LTWVTQKPAEQLLLHNPLIDRVLTTSPDDLLALSSLEFDIALVADKSLKAAGVLKQTKADLLFGFQVDPRSGAIVPATAAATELWELGLSNEKKFFVNQKPETQLATEALELGPFKRDEYIIHLSECEKAEALARRKDWSAGGKTIVGLNTGCSSVIPYKRLSIEKHRELISRLQRDPNIRVVLLGGKEDTLRNERIGHGSDVIQSATADGIRDGLISIEACDIVVTGDSLGMHMAIGLKKWVVAWFGPTCAQEIDLFDRGVKVQTRASCNPCWKRSCQRDPMCYDLVSIEELLLGVRQGKIAQDASRSKRPPTFDNSDRISR
jgi:heptosyltransferase II